jgi:DNA-directed RNA polymerase specialized sigma24 family protein
MLPTSSCTTTGHESGSHTRIVNLPDAQNATPSVAHVLPSSSPSRTLPPTPIAEERARIVRLCLRATHDPDAAEDLAQETLLEAWRHWEKPREPDDPQARARWLSAIAANVCRRWAHTSSRELAHITQLTMSGEGQEPAAGIDLLADEGDAVDAALEHAERAHLLDRALGLLPPC